MLTLLFSRTGAMVAGIVIATLIAVWAVTAAYQAGRNAERTAALTTSVEILRERSAIDDQTRSMDSGSLCRALGGVWVSDERTCQ
ncbi:hypothetical protein [Aquamicrobium zhengzhouense]|uniref:Uncharacterized protein n=1 Tax=Aquamicrobium zhengzhouense TaxID=2781738 RepID=A0ABS0SDY3_9HYPH|nr:hypothetical protein [Aquamicrobium zhengzhouense]MBI1621515.1 hypothetical protein [Aquamicrobium zhengzhouense]